MEDNTPERFYRGISTKDAISSEGYITEAAFSFDDFAKNPRDDNYCELSVNWNDNEGASPTVTFDYDFSQRHILVVSDDCTVKNEIKVVFTNKEQADSFKGMCFSWE